MGQEIKPALTAPQQVDKLAITRERLKAWNACSDGYRWFLERYPQGASYQVLYAALRDDKRFDDERWLTERVFAELDCQQQVSVSVETLGADRKSIETEVAANAERSEADSSKLAASGYYSQLAASGDYSQLAASGDSSQLAASGKASIAMAAATNCTASAGELGCIVLTRWVESEKRFRVSVGYVGEDGIEAGKAYRLNGSGAFVEVAA